MPTVVYRVTQLLSSLVKPLPIGTNLGLFHLLWMLVSGRLLESRGAVIPGLAARCRVSVVASAGGGRAPLSGARRQELHRPAS
jgi:hypothetical protein